MEPEVSPQNGEEYLCFMGTGLDEAEKSFIRKYGRKPEKVGYHREGQGYVYTLAGPVYQQDKENKEEHSYD